MLWWLSLREEWDAVTTTEYQCTDVKYMGLGVYVNDYVCFASVAWGIKIQPAFVLVRVVRSG